MPTTGWDRDFEGDVYGDVGRLRYGDKKCKVTLNIATSMTHAKIGKTGQIWCAYDLQIIVCKFFSCSVRQEKLKDEQISIASVPENSQLPDPSYYSL